MEILSASSPHTFTGEWYDLAVESHFWIQWRQAALLAQLRQVGVPLDRPLRVLEVGCGTGVLRAGLEEATEWVIDGADLSMEALSQAKTGRGRTLFYDVFDEHESLSEAYDVVILFDVLEHIEATQPFLHSVLRHLAPGGWFLLNVPAVPGLYSDYDRVLGHVRRYDRPTLGAEFTGGPLVIDDMRYWGVSLLALLAMRAGVLRLKKPTRADIVNLGFRPPNPLVNRLLCWVMQAETTLWRRPLLGTSLLLVGHKA